LFKKICRFCNVFELKPHNETSCFTKFLSQIWRYVQDTCEICAREETRRRNKFWNAKHWNRSEYQKCRVVFSLPLLVSMKCRRVFRSREENRRQKCVERYKITKCFSNDLSRFWYLCYEKIFFLEDNFIYYMFISSMFRSFHLMKYYANLRKSRTIGHKY